MPLVDVDLDLDTDPIPPEVGALLRDADERIGDFIERRRDDPIPAFVPSDFEMVFRALRTIERRRAAPGSALCEWGSGFGVVACLASMLDYDACGIEIEPDLVDEAQRLASDHELNPEFVCGSLVPAGAEHLTDIITDSAWLASGGADGHDELGLDPDDFDVVFAYPWPGEETVIERIFRRCGAVGAILITYRGIEDCRFQRKVAGRNRR